MRIALVLVIALAAAGCAKKSKPAAAPVAPPEKTLENSAPGGENKPADDAADESGPKKPGDPCDGGETKKK